MSFADNIAVLAQRAPSLLDHVMTEEATKNALVMPFIAALGYDVFNPQEVVPELTADVGIKKGEKVDYAIKLDGEIIMLIECKPAGTNLREANMSQLFRYFTVTNARIGILADPDAAETTKIAEATAPAAEATTPPANRQRPAKKAAPAKKPDLELLDHKTEGGDFGMTYITGRVKNNRSRPYNYAQVQFSIYNEAGEQIESAWANTAGLDAGGVWRFKAHVSSQDQFRYKLTGLSGW